MGIKLQSSSHLGLCHAKTFKELRVLDGELNDLQACKALYGCVKQQHEPVHPLHILDAWALRGGCSTQLPALKRQLSALSLHPSKRQTPS